ncbi:ADAPTOR COMPLEXES SMALL SUBUNIT FAMILY [Salix viminalis]|uniref:AP complex subunit sigma n=1 Tax=Salix viminalis TaxID=40686 RepID=A0A9Q0ZQ80_SALVM|nr:ADAPTOR COMPLEXES SMALL SUBUNIT FAMILY [Salix viminalis]
MGIRFILMVNKQGQTRLAQYYEWLTLEERRALEGEIVRKCLARNDQQCSFVEHRNYKIVYRRYASLFFLVGVDNDEPTVLISFMLQLLKSGNHYYSAAFIFYAVTRVIFMISFEHGYGWSRTMSILEEMDGMSFAILEFIHLLVETMDRHFGNVCELDIMFHLEKAHFMLEEMVMNGCIVETSKANILSPIQLMDKTS